MQASKSLDAKAAEDACCILKNCTPSVGAPLSQATHQASRTLADCTACCRCATRLIAVQNPSCLGQPQNPSSRWTPKGRPQPKAKIRNNAPQLRNCKAVSPPAQAATPCLSDCQRKLTTPCLSGKGGRAGCSCGGIPSPTSCHAPLPRCLAAGTCQLL